MADLSGKIIKSYEIISLLGKGSFGAVYRAYQPALQREVAIKSIHPEYANRPDFIRRFEFEARLIAQIEHLHIVPIHDFWRDSEGAFIVMRLMRGESLKDRLAHAPLSVELAFRQTIQIASALSAAHRAGVVHRDIKPANILLDEEDNAYLTDFGIAKSLDGEGSSTQTGMFIGTPQYATPEQAQSAGISPQTDIYSLGTVFYEMVSGDHPFRDTPISDMLMKHLYESLPPLEQKFPHLPLGIDEIIQRATAKDPGARYETAFSMVADLEQLFYKRSSSFDSDIEIQAPNPYKGLRAFQESDCEDFFGREALTGELLSRLLEDGPHNRFLAVVGPSGSGKSSAVKAGLLPAIRKGALPDSEKWFIVEMLPGSTPFLRLEEVLEKVSVSARSGLGDILTGGANGLALAARLALPSDEDRLLLVIDQFEELFTLVEDRAETNRFLDTIAHAVQDDSQAVSVIATLRADFYDRPLEHPAFGQLIKHRMHPVLPLSGAELSAAIHGPAERVGAGFELGLVNEISADVHEQPGALPLLQYALTELFERREGRLLTRTAYHEIGGVFGALGQRAEDIFNDLSTEQQAAARQVFLRLVTLGEGVEDTRRRVLRVELESLSLVEHARTTATGAILNIFGRFRLLTFDRDAQTRSPTVEVAHEALLSEWARLRSWLEESRDDVRMQRRLDTAAAEWLAHERDPGFLLRSTRLAQFDAWAKESRVVLSERERELLEQSREAQKVREAREAEREARGRELEARARRILTWLVGVLAAATFIAIILSTIAFNQQRAARWSAATATVAQGLAQQEAATARAAEDAAARQAVAAAQSAELALAEQQTAEREARFSLSRELAASALSHSRIDGDPDLGLLLAILSARLTMEIDGILTLQSEIALHQALREARPRSQFTIRHNARSISLSEDGNTLLSTGHPDLGTRASGSYGFLWDVSPGVEGEAIHTLLGHSSSINASTFSPDGKTVATGSGDRTIRLWDVASGSEFAVLRAHREAITDLAFTPDGHSLVSSSLDGTAIIWDLASGEPRFVLSIPGGELRDLEVSLSGSLLAILTRDNVSTWDIASGSFVWEIPIARASNIFSIVFSQDGRYLIGSNSHQLATGGGRFTYEHEIIVWNVQNGEMVNVVCCLERLTNAVVSNFRFIIETFAGTNYILSGGPEGIYTWNVLSDRNLGPIFYTCCFPSTEDRPNIDIATDRERVFVAGGAGVRALDFSLGRAFPPLFGFPGAVTQVAYSPGGEHFATASGGQVRVWQVLQEGTQAIQVEELPTGIHNEATYAISFSPDGTRLVTAGKDRTVRTWSLVGENPVQELALSGHTGPVRSVTFHPGGQQLVSAGDDRTAILWDLESGDDLQVLRGHTDTVHAAVFNLDGTRVATASADSTVRIWNPETGNTLLTLRGHEDAVLGLSYSPDGSQLISVSADQTAILWDLESGKAILSFAGHASSVTDATFSPDGDRIYTASEDGTIRVWDTANGRELFQLLGHDGAVLTLAIRPDGGRLLSGGEDGRLNFYVLEINDLLTFAADAITREFTPEECQIHLQMDACPVIQP